MEEKEERMRGRGRGHKVKGTERKAEGVPPYVSKRKEMKGESEWGGWNFIAGE